VSQLTLAGDVVGRLLDLEVMLQPTVTLRNLRVLEVLGKARRLALDEA
jgi:hypothetical protein